MTDGRSGRKTCFQRPMVVCIDPAGYSHYIAGYHISLSEPWHWHMVDVFVLRFGQTVRFVACGVSSPRKRRVEDVGVVGQDFGWHWVV